MASPVKLYQQEMHDNLGFFATWLPADQIDVGDAGVLEAGRFRKQTSLAEIGIHFSVADASATQDVKYTATQGARMTTSAGAAIGQVAKAEISLEFSRTGAFVFHASGLRQRTIRNPLAVSDKLVTLAEKGRWQGEWLLVESVYVASCATIIVSEDNSAGLVLAANTDGVLSGISLADPRVGLTITSTRGRIVHVIGDNGLHPLYSCVRLKPKLFGASTLEAVRGSGENEPAYSRPGIGQLIDS